MSKFKVPVKIMKGGLIRLPAALIRYTELRKYYESGEPVVITINLEETDTDNDGTEFYTTIKKWKTGRTSDRYIIPVPSRIAKLYSLDKHVGKPVKIKIIPVEQEG